MQLLHEVIWKETQVLNMNVVTGGKQAAVVEFEVPMTPEIASTLECLAVYSDNRTPRHFFKKVDLDIGKIQDARFKAEACELTAKTVTNWSVRWTTDGLMLRFKAKFTEGFFDIVAGFVQEQRDEAFDLKIIPPVCKDSRATSEDHAVAPAPQVQ